MGNILPQPFSSFGAALKNLREKNNKTLPEVSGAIEIDQSVLKSYEKGENRPTEDILLLLIQHFSLKNDEALEIWRLAGYSRVDFNESEKYFINDPYGEIKQPQAGFLSQNDPVIVYTDMIQVMVNNYGVILNFMQGAGVNSQPLAVAKVGMSKEHAKSVLEVLKKTIEQADELDKKKSTKRISAGKQKQE